jgi:methylated-DNA-[protein]-cysteine S-methyltransferase
MNSVAIKELLKEELNNKSFSEKVYDITRQIPAGKVTTYRALANALNTKAYRAVGNAMNKNPYSYLSNSPILKKVPCHRVINSSGKLGGFATGLKNKIKLLKEEGVEIKDDIIDLKVYEYKF